jgi:predicted dehydrogenase
MDGTKYLGVGIVGTDWVTTPHIQAFERNPYTRVAAICSRERARAQSRAESMGLKPCVAYDDYEAMLRDPDIHIMARSITSLIASERTSNRMSMSQMR